MHSSRLRGVRSEASAEEIEGKPGWSHFHETGPREADRGTTQRTPLVHVGHILVRLLRNTRDVRGVQSLLEPWDRQTGWD